MKRLHTKRFQDKSGPDELRLICKTTAQDATADGLMMQFLFDAEAEIYGSVFPILEEVAKLQEPLPWSK